MFRFGNRIIFLILFALLIGFVYTPFDPYYQGYLEFWGKTIAWPHLLGVDQLGQDAFSRVWRGAANSIGFGILSSSGVMLLSVLILILEQVSGSAGSRLIRSVVALGIALPVMFLGLLFLIFLERSPYTLVLAISIAGSPFAFRQLRVLWLEQRGTTHVEASRAIGGNFQHLFFFSIWPNLKPQFFELWKIVLAISILEMSALTFLGLAGDPNWAELGSLLSAHQKHVMTQPALVIWPGVVLSGILWLIRQARIE